MTIRRLPICCLLILITVTNALAQTKGNANFLQLDRTLVQWNDFSFAQPWEKLKEACGLIKVESLSPDYLEYYCGEITDTGKSYILTNGFYHQFAGTTFDRVILHLKGHKNSLVNYNQLSFVEQLPDSTQGDRFYGKLLNTLKGKYGVVNTDHLEKEPIGQPLAEKTYLNDLCPFSAVEETEWEGGNNVHMELRYIKENNLIILAIEEYVETGVINSRARNLFRESEYDETFSEAFKDFDKRNGYKGLKFGQSKLAVKSLASIKGPSADKDYEIITPSYRRWFDMSFDLCNIQFNKHGLLYDLTLLKVEFSDEDYTTFLRDLVELFGPATQFRLVSNASEATRWAGMHIELTVLRNLENRSLYIDFTNSSFDDSSQTDKLY